MNLISSYMGNHLGRAVTVCQTKQCFINNKLSNNEPGQYLHE